MSCFAQTRIFECVSLFLPNWTVLLRLTIGGWLVKFRGQDLYQLDLQEWVRSCKSSPIMGDQMFPFPNRIEKLRQSLKRLLLRRKLADKNTFDGEPYAPGSLNILRAAETQGYVLSVANNKTIAATKNNVTLFVRSNGDIQRFGQNRGFI